MNSLEISILLYCGVVMVTVAHQENSTSNSTISPETYSELNTIMSSSETFSSNQANNDASPSTSSPKPTSRTTSPANTQTTPRANSIPLTTARECLFEKREGGIVLMVMGGLVVLCTVLLVCTLALSFQVCHLKHHRRSGTSSRPTRSNIDLVSAGHWGTSQRAKERPGFDAEMAEASPLIAELKQTQDGEGRATVDQGIGKDTTAEDTPKTEGGEATTAKGSDTTTSNGAAGPTKGSSPSKQPAEPEVTIATSTASSDAAVG
ncbi:uncharacterized protein LOC105028665 [Esox lucius]|uniref:uncharacterized protein LOC105028665 n=1 Tax=Esox lucius TaxID=8010 RepID=UPI000577F875|nr:uncharacterized protein LOC105028665 [Esox lucius]